MVMSDNTPRFPSTSGGHVESYFLRANHPTEPRAFWLKATVLRRDDGSAVAESWCALFDGARTWAGKTTVPLNDAGFSGDPTQIHVGGARLSLGTEGTLSGAIDSVSWDLNYVAVDGPISEPLCMFPLRRMVDGSFPKSKLLTPKPALHFSGTVTWDDETWEVSDWLGMQGHNWGKQHALEYAWGQVLFPGSDGAPVAMAEAFSGKLKLGPVITPFLSALVVRRAGKTYRFNRIVDLWRQKVVIDDMHWCVTMRGSGGEAMLSMRADHKKMVCLGYLNPDDALSYCLNSKIARVELRVNPTNEEGFRCFSEHGGALEFLRRTPDPRFEKVV